MIDIIFYHKVKNKNLLYKYRNYLKIVKLIEILSNWHISKIEIIFGIVGFKTNKYSNLICLYLFVLYFHFAIIHHIMK